VYAGVDPITRREIRLKATARPEQQAHIELGKLLKEASEGRTPESDAIMVPRLTQASTATHLRGASLPMSCMTQVNRLSG
jgi:hypothetical protein